MRAGRLVIVLLFHGAMFGSPIITPAVAQTPITSADRAMQIAQARQANAALMHKYTWNSRTEILKDDQVKDTRIEQVFYDPNGQLQHSLLNEQKPGGFFLPTPIGFLRRAIAANEKEQMEQYLTGLKGMLEQYTLPTAGKILDFMTTATPTGPDANGLFQMAGGNVVVPGDNLTLWVNPWTKHVRRMQVNSTFQGDPVQLNASFESLPSGLNYVSFAEATAPAKQLSVKVHNYNYSAPY